jgi:NTP pyrophosphatase (non-canonical NTP hydrolase)
MNINLFKSMKLSDLQKTTHQISKTFPTKWGGKTRLIDLVEEVGELANAILVKESDKPKSRAFQGEEGLADSLCDILYDILILASYYHIDLEEEYVAMLEKLKKRISSGEFTPDK